ncbi:MAG: sugar transferase [Longimonas sp.]|uniref:sugar transferase n=1 Tax=Longimonas sp. TaxID=2039626 RepID=UPI0033523609
MSYSHWKVVLDRVVAAGLLLLLSPVLLAVAAAILLVDGRPVFFTQQRAGKHGQPFRIYKFRTLGLGPKDPLRPGAHCTRTGAFLRRWALDELPQLWNIVMGEMSVVGPRPTLLDQVRRYNAFERQRLHVRPGLTGWAQVNGRNALSWPERIELDVWYVEHRSFGLDLGIMWRTPFVLMQGKGVYGPMGRNDTIPRSPAPDSLS